MKIRSITVLAVILVLLGGIYYVDYKRLVERREAAAVRDDLLPFKVETIESIAVTTSQGQYRLEKRSEGAKSVWWLTEPIHERAAQSVADGLLGAFRDATRVGKFEYAETEAEALGLADSDLKVLVRGKSGELRLDFGKESPVRGKAYVSFAKGEAWVTAMGLRRALLKKVLDLRDKKVLPFEFENLQQVFVQDKNTTSPLTITREASGDWMIHVREADAGSTVSVEASYQADPRGVYDFCMFIDALKAIDTVTSDSLRRSLQTSRTPHYVLRFDYVRDNASTSSSSLQSTTLLLRVPRAPDDLTEVSPNAPLPGTYCATVAGREGLVYQVDDGLMRTIRFPKESFRDRSIITLDQDKIDSFVISWQDKDLAIGNLVNLSRDAEKEWHLTYGYSTLVNQARVESYVNFCLKQQVTSFNLDPAPQSAVEAGLVEPAFRVVFQSGDRSDGFEFGGRIKPNEPYYYARRIMGTGLTQARSAIFAMGLPDSYIQALCKTNSSFIFQPIMSFKREDLREVLVAMSNSSTITLSLQPEVSPLWRGVYPGETSRTLSANVVDPLLDLLGEMEYSVLARNVTAELLEKSGMMPPPLAILLRGEGGETLCAMFFPIVEKEERLLLVTDHLGRYMYVANSEMTRLQDVLGTVVARLR